MNIKNRMDVLRATTTEDLNIEMEMRHLKPEGLNRFEMILEILAHDLYMEKLGEMENAASKKVIYFDANKMTAYPLSVTDDQIRMIEYLMDRGALEGHIYYASDTEDWEEV